MKKYLLPIIFQILVIIAYFVIQDKSPTLMQNPFMQIAFSGVILIFVLLIIFKKAFEYNPKSINRTLCLIFATIMIFAFILVSIIILGGIKIDESLFDTYY